MDNVRPAITSKVVISRVVFDRIRDDHDIADLEVRHVDKEQLAAMIRDYVLPYMEYPEFALHITQEAGWIDAVTYNAGNFTITTTEETTVAAEPGAGDDLLPGRQTLTRAAILQSAAQKHLDAAMRLEASKHQLAQTIRTAVENQLNPEWIADQTGLEVSAVEQIVAESPPQP